MLCLHRLSTLSSRSRPGVVVTTAIRFGPAITIGATFGTWGWWIGSGFVWPAHTILSTTVRGLQRSRPTRIPKLHRGRVSHRQSESLGKGNFNWCIIAKPRFHPPQFWKLGLV